MFRTLLFLFLAGCTIGRAADRCVSCHPKEVAGYQKTAMANSLSKQAVQPSGQFRHALSDSEFRIRTDRGGMTHSLEREGVSGSFPVAYVIGSGNHAFGYLINQSGFLFQSPISYYAKKRIWDMAPGYEADRSPDFTRPVTAECLWCHAGKPLPVSGTLNKFEQPAFAEESISCQRCHGGTEAHLKQPSASNILNPKRLTPRARDSVCEQCHLSGEARIPNPGEQIGSFRPGLTLEDVFSVYVFEKPADARLKVISHSEQLAQSVCRLRSGDRLWCGTCHNPHEKPLETISYYREKCLECHSETMKKHPAPAENCIGCHMPTRPARDGGHTAFTDHEIRRKPADASAPAARTGKLVAWYPPAAALAQRNLGLAYAAVGERDRSAPFFDQAFGLLSGEGSSQKNDGAVMTTLGLLSLRRRKTTEALEYFQNAMAAEPNYAPYRINVATALMQSGNLKEAASQLEQAIAFDPSLEPAYRKLAEVYRGLGQPQKLESVFQKYLRFMPQNVNARIALQAQ